MCTRTHAAARLCGERCGGGCGYGGDAAGRFCKALTILKSEAYIILRGGGVCFNNVGGSNRVIVTGLTRC